MERNIEDVLAETSGIRAAIDDARTVVIDHSRSAIAISEPRSLPPEFAGIAQAMSNLREALTLIDSLASETVRLALQSAGGPPQPGNGLSIIVDQVEAVSAQIRAVKRSD